MRNRFFFFSLVIVNISNPPFCKTNFFFPGNFANEIVKPYKKQIDERSQQTYNGICIRPQKFTSTIYLNDENDCSIQNRKNTNLILTQNLYNFDFIWIRNYWKLEISFLFHSAVSDVFRKYNQQFTDINIDSLHFIISTINIKEVYFFVLFGFSDMKDIVNNEFKRKSKLHRKGLCFYSNKIHTNRHKIHNRL